MRRTTWAFPCATCSRWAAGIPMTRASLSIWLISRLAGAGRSTASAGCIALAATRAGNLFTTHTAVAAGFDVFSPGLMEQYFAMYAQDDLGSPMRDLLALGRRNPGDASEPFNMAYLATRGSGAVNGVSRLHRACGHARRQSLHDSHGCCRWI